MQLTSGLPTHNVDQIRTSLSTELINEIILGIVMYAVKVDSDVFEFCDVMEKLCDGVNVIRALRNGMWF